MYEKRNWVSKIEKSDFFYASISFTKIIRLPVNHSDELSNVNNELSNVNNE